MRTQDFTTAVKDGLYASIDEFKPGEGEKCGCICPECGQGVRSNITAKSPEELKVPFKNHFSHIDTTTACTGGVRKTDLHLLTYEALGNSTEIKVPGIPLGQTSTLAFHKAFFKPVKNNEIPGKYRPDLVIENPKGHQFVVAIDSLSELTKKYYRKHKIPVLQLDFTPIIESEATFDRQAIVHKIIYDTDSKSWIGSRKFLEILHSNGIHPISSSRKKHWKKVPNILLIAAGLVVGAVGFTQWIRHR